MSQDVKSLLLYGSNFDYILFKNAVRFAENGGKIWFISPERFQELPTGITILDKEILKNITMLYLKNSSGLLKHLNSIHIWYTIPEIIILNNFHKYRTSDEANSVEWAYLCASLIDAGRICARKLNKSVTLLVSCSIDSNNNNLVQNIVDLYFDDVINSEDLLSNCIIPNI